MGSVTVYRSMNSGLSLLGNFVAEVDVILQSQNIDHQWLRILFRYEIFKDMSFEDFSYDESTNIVIVTDEAWTQYAQVRVC